MDLLLTHGYFLYEDPKELQIMKPYVPLGILYLASHLRARNFDVEVFDTTFSSRQDLLRLLESAELPSSEMAERFGAHRRARRFRISTANPGPVENPFRYSSTLRPGANIMARARYH